DDTLFALSSGTVKFKTKKARKFDGKLVNTKFVEVEKNKK
ncbi:MAG TPA: 50S ribosomal protein L27, partial [Patescibacteria group bacterium]|nr:50S ribosomal protein L27 [Patescibacteria group bacterium]